MRTIREHRRAALCLNEPTQFQSQTVQVLQYHYHALISNHFAKSVNGPEKAGVAGTTPCLHETCRGLAMIIHHSVDLLSDLKRTPCLLALH